MSTRIAIGIIGLGVAGVLSAGDVYLGYVGPTPLRFSPPSSGASKFIWPPLFRVATNGPSSLVLPPPGDLVSNSTALSSAVATSPDNGMVATSSEKAALTNTFAAQLPSFSVLPDGSAPPVSPPVFVTPEMLAEYFRMNPGMAQGPFSNTIPLGGLWFVPPVPRMPSESKATYRVQ